MAKKPKPPAWPALNVKLRATAELVPYAKNAKLHTSEQIELIARSIDEFGWTMAVLVDEKGEIIAGHGRVLAAALRGIVEVPVATAVGWTDNQKRLYRIADNQLTLMSDLDVPLITAELLELNAAGLDLSLTGFTGDELLGYGIGTPPPEAEEAPPLPVVPVSRLDDLWVLGKHRLLCGDATKAEDVERLLAGAKPAVMVADPPYGVDYDPNWRNGTVESFPNTKRAVGRFAGDDRADWFEAWALFPGGVVYVWHSGTKGPSVALDLERAGFEIRAQIIWVKQHFAISRGNYHPKHEPCWYAVRKGSVAHWSGGRKQATVWEITSLSPVGNKGGRDLKNDAKTGHGTQKPLECMLRPIMNNSKRGDSIYDPFVGSGTTIIACEQSGRRALAIDIDPRYVDVAVLRWEAVTKKKATLDGRTFEDVARERSKKARWKAARSRGKPVRGRRRGEHRVRPPVREGLGAEGRSPDSVAPAVHAGGDTPGRESE